MKEKNRERFLKSPYLFTTEALGEPRSGTLECPQGELEEHLSRTLSDEQRDDPLEPREDLFLPAPPEKKKFDEGDIRWKEVSDIMRNARYKSSPGPSGIPYLVYKRCPLLLRRLWKLLRVVWRKGVLPKEWMLADGCFIPKELVSEGIDMFRGISLLSVELKIYLAVFAKRMTSYMIENEYLDTHVQKGGIPGQSGCIEHNAVVTQLVREAKQQKGDLTIIWLDLANAYGSIPHRLIDLAMTRYHFPEWKQELVLSYYHSIKVRFTTKIFTTTPQRVEKGIVTGCTISVVLFVMAFNLLIKTAQSECRGPTTRSGCHQPSIRVFMDDITVTTERAVGARWILKMLERLVEWSKMKFKARKSRSVVISKGKVQENYQFRIQGEEIPSLRDQPIKCLGKWYQSSLNDQENVKNFIAQLKEFLNRIEDTHLPGKFKVWMLHHGLIPKLRWPMMLYGMAISTVERMERQVSRRIKKWLRIPRSLSAVALYSTSSKLQRPFQSLTEEFKLARTGTALTICDSKDSCVRSAGVLQYSGRKWSVNTAIQKAETRLQQEEIVGIVCRGRQGIGYQTTQLWSREGTRGGQVMIQKKVRQL